MRYCYRKCYTKVTIGVYIMKNYTLRLTVRALIVQADKLFLVSNDGHFWYTPGGGIEANETLPECAIREVKEETGISIQVNDVIYVYDFFDIKNELHKVEIYFTTQIKSNRIPKDWSDEGGNVQYVKFFSLEELKHMDNVAPGFLKEGKWLKTNIENIYKGVAVQAMAST